MGVVEGEGARGASSKARAADQEGPLVVYVYPLAVRCTAGTLPARASRARPLTRAHLFVSFVCFVCYISWSSAGSGCA
jgi:hypothetical protein